MLYLVLLLGMIMIVAYAGGSSLFVYPKGWVITFLVSTKGGHVFLRGVLLVATGPPGRNYERSLSHLCLLCLLRLFQG